MKELKAILAAYKKRDSTQQAALATVVKVSGSSYRSPGARMLITDDGKWVGSISGGCLEGDALRKARLVMTSKQPMTVTYDTREESNQNLGISLGCNGIIDVLIEPFSETHNPIALFDQIIQQNQPVVMATVFCGAGHVGKKIVMNATGKMQTSPDSQFLTQIKNHITEISRLKKSVTLSVPFEGADLSVFMEWIEPTVSLLIFGGGFDARPVNQLAKSVGWEVQVTDECVAHIAPIFFPGADRLSLCNRDFIDRDFRITPYTACILMSHNYEYDRDVLKKVIHSPSPYIGILGPRKRFDKMQDEFRKAGFELSSNHLERIHSPIGLDIGAEAADEIAVSIIAEIQSKFSNRPSGFLRDVRGPIHIR
jgi:xanthine dehydrogenase accessory factor